MRGMRATIRAELACAAVLIVVGSAGAAPEKVQTPVSPAIPSAAKHSSMAAHTTVLPLSEGPNLLEAGASHFWTPQAADLRRLEKDLPPSIAGYYRQYIGIVKDGKKQIYINGFSSDVAPEFIGGKGDWHRHAVSVLDGGMGFFEATYDPKTRKFTVPEFHGMG